MKGDIGGSVSEHHPASSLHLLGIINLKTMVDKNNKIFKINRDRAFAILWYADSFYDTLGYCNYSLVADKMTKADWAIIAPYFDPNNYRADVVLEMLKEQKKEVTITNVSNLYTKELVLEFAFWYHNWLLNRERKSVEQEFERFLEIQKEINTKPMF